MIEPDRNETTISTTPAKRFFVEMLTRDIELADAILDLLDNCLDGALRSNERDIVPPDAEKPYLNYWAKITLDDEHFRIEDNCGGIPLDLARDKAFRFGRPDRERDNDLKTVGVYGIGMKRAIFKLGADCHVLSRHSSGSFGVHIDEKWIASDDSWDLEMDKSVTTLDEDGVMIEVRSLHPQIALQFHPNKGNFQETLRKKVREHYAYIIRKGFKVSINGVNVVPERHVVLVDQRDKENRIAPYVYRTEYDGVSVILTMGMYESFPSDSELNELLEGKRGKHSAGWTVVCNDRVVLANDTTHVTGWGEAGVPVYHGQFNMLSGVVEFSSADASKLPITTTKRGVDLSSRLYADVKGVMRDALKHFTSFTNHWKGQSRERTSMQAQAQPIEIREVAQSIRADQWKTVRTGLKGERFVPTLPKPKDENANARIAFSRPKTEVELVEAYLFDLNDTPKPSQVAERAFEWVLEKARA